MTAQAWVDDDELDYSFARSSGPGGQNVNKTNSKAVLYWNIEESESVPDDVRIRFQKVYHNRITEEGVVVLACDETRDRIQNQARCKEKLLELLQTVWVPPKVRKPTKPTKSSKRRRVETKRQRSSVKSGRGKVRDFGE